MPFPGDTTIPALQTLNDAYDRAVMRGTVPDLFAARNNPVSPDQGFHPTPPPQQSTTTPSQPAATPGATPQSQLASALALQQILQSVGPNGILPGLTGIRPYTTEATKRPLARLAQARDRFADLAATPAIDALFDPFNYSVSGRPITWPNRIGIIGRGARPDLSEITLDPDVLNAAVAALLQMTQGAT
jgi:hypothetical protein